MSTNKDIIIRTLQKGLVGHLNSDSNLNPAYIADAILTNTNLAKSHDEFKYNKVVTLLNDQIKDLKDSMNGEYKKLKSDEKLLGNFIQGKITSYEEILENINTL